ncbi:glycosyltransferase [Candidatus Uhrbacteria bacterium]|nr:glycosyltransferase [Candidatus Uhrbacteria bacterium]
MRVLLVNKFWYPKGGSERYTFLLKYLLEAKGHEVIPFAMDDERNVPTPWSTHFVSHVDFWEAADAAPNQTSLLQKLSRIMWSREAARKIGAVIDEVKPDIAHLQNFTHQISPSILAVLRRRNVPIVWTLHDLDVFRPGYRMPRAWGRRALAWVEYVFHHTILNVYRRNIDCIIAPSRFVADAVRGWGWRGRVEVVPNFIEGIRNQGTEHRRGIRR